MKQDQIIESEWQRLLELFEKAKSTEELDEIFNLLITAEEKKDLINRYRIVRELIKGEKTQRQIAKDLNVSIAKITRGSNFLKTLTDDFYQYIKKKIGRET